MSSSVTPRRDWKDNLREGTIVHATTPWSRWPGVQLMHMSHSMREFEIFSNVHAVLMNAGAPVRYELRNSLGRSTVELPPQTLSFVSAGSRYQAESASGVSEDIGLMILPQALESFADSASLRISAVQFEDQFGRPDEASAQILRLLSADAATGHPNGSLFGESLLQAFFVRQFARPLLESPEPKGHPQLVGAIKDFVDAQLHQNFTLAELAEALGYSPYYLHRLFRAATGHRLHDYVISQRIERAMRLLTKTDLPLPLIADRTGFCDASHLSRQFRRRMRCTPEEFRRAHRSPNL